DPGGQAARGLRQRVDRRSERVHPTRLPQGRDAAVRDAAGRPARRAGQVPRRLLQGSEVTTTVVGHHPPATPPRQSGARRYLLGAGWIRAAWMMCLFWGIGLGLVLVFRWWAGWDPLFKWSVITVVATLTSAPVGFLAGLGSFDYWGRYVSGAPTQPEDHSTHG